jgi:GAF domain-containing protein
LQTIKSRLKIIVGCERSEVYVVDRRAQELLSFRARQGSKANPTGARLWTGRFPMDAGIVGTIILDKSMQVVKDVQADARFDALVDGIGSNGVTNLVAYPILMRDKVEAVVVAVNKLASNGRGCEDFSSTDVAAIQDFATLATLVLPKDKADKADKERVYVSRAH